MVRKNLLSKLTSEDYYNIQTHIAVIFLPKDVKKVFMSDMTKNRLNEHLMLNLAATYSLRLKEQPNDCITRRLETDTINNLDNYFTDVVKLYVLKNYPDYPELLI